MGGQGIGIERGCGADVTMEVTFNDQLEEMRYLRKEVSRSQNTLGESAGTHRATQPPTTVKA